MLRPVVQVRESLSPTVRAPLGLILVAYFALASGYAVATPRWNNPDEPAHFSYVREVAETGRLPVLRMGDWDADLLERLKATRFPDDAAIEAIRYEAHQPPLYYVVAAAVYRLTGGFSLASQVLALKGLSILFGAVVVIVTFGAGRLLCPSDPRVALLAAAMAAFVPMHTAISAAINNDSLANALAALTCLLLLTGLRRGFDDRATIVLGLLLGALLLTKLTVYVWVPLALSLLTIDEFGRARAEEVRSWWIAIRRPLLAACTAAAVSAWWFVRNALVYGWADPLAAARHDAVVVGQPRWVQLDAAAGDYLARVIFRSFWGQFGWMGVALEDRLYLLYLLLTVLALIGLALSGAGWLGKLRNNSDLADRHAEGEEKRHNSPVILRHPWAYGPPTPMKTGYVHESPSSHVILSGAKDLMLTCRVVSMRSFAPLRMTCSYVRRGLLLAAWPGRAVVVLVAAILLVLAALGYYNVRFIQAQGRYLFPALLPIAVLFSLGWVRLADAARRSGRLGAVPLTILVGAVSWALLDAVVLLVSGQFSPLRIVLPIAALAGLVVLVLPRARRTALSGPVLGGLGVGLGLLDLLCLLRFVQPAFR